MKVRKARAPRKARAASARDGDLMDWREFKGDTPATEAEQEKAARDYDHAMRTEWILKLPPAPEGYPWQRSAFKGKDEA